MRQCAYVVTLELVWHCVSPLLPPSDAGKARVEVAERRSEERHFGMTPATPEHGLAWNRPPMGIVGNSFREGSPQPRPRTPFFQACW